MWITQVIANSERAFPDPTNRLVATSPNTSDTTYHT